MSATLMMNRTAWYNSFILRYYYSRTPLIRKLVILIANYRDRLSPSGKFFKNSTKLTCFEIAGYRIKYSAVLWLLELHIVSNTVQCYGF